MYRVELHNRIDQIISIFNWIGFWHREDEPTVRQTRIKVFYSLYYLLFLASVIEGVFTSDTKNETLFSTNVAIMTAVLSIRLFYIIWKQKQIMNLLSRIAVYTIRGQADVVHVNNKLNNFMKFSTFFVCSCNLSGIFGGLVFPFLGSEKKLFLNVALPSDYKNNGTAFWMAFIFINTEIFFTVIVCLFPVITWYFLLNCSLRYEVLANQLVNMGGADTCNRSKRNISERGKEELFFDDLITGIKSYEEIKK